MTALWGGGGLYERWAAYLDAWAAGQPVDPAGPPQLAADAFPGDTWQRLADRITEALSRRLRSWADALTRGVAEARDEFGVARALGHARWGLRTIRALAGHRGLPPDLRQRLLEVVDQQVRSAQQAIEDQIEAMRRGGADRTAVEARLRTVRLHTLTVVTGEEPADTPDAARAWTVDPAPARRRVILDRSDHRPR
jgi:hypothetical protein